MQVSEGFKDLVAGFLDGDGSVGIHKQSPNFRQGLVNLWENRLPYLLVPCVLAVATCCNYL